MNLHHTLYLTLVFFIFSNKQLNAQKKIDVQGHRGCRALLPENTIPAFIKAIDLGVTTLEMDVIITKDNKVVLSHEPFLSHEICAGPNKEVITEQNEKEYNLYQMNYSDIKQCDCGTKLHPRFLTQQKQAAYKPLLESVIDTVEKYIAFKKLKPIHYNIETKCLPKTDSIFHPIPTKFVELVYSIIKNKKISKRVTLQSFDVRTLQYANLKKLPLKLALLVENKNSFEQNISELGFNPDIYSPNYNFLNEELVNKCHMQKMKLIPWTVNTNEDIKRILELNVDGIISDYPDRVMEYLNKK